MNKSTRMIIEEYVKKNFNGSEYDIRMFLIWLYFERG